jgi:hypothetical protein
VGEGGDHSNDSIGDVVFFTPILSLWMGHAKKQAGGQTDKTKPMLTKSHLLVDWKPFIEKLVLKNPRTATWCSEYF